MSPLELIKKAFGIFKKKSAAPSKAADAPFEHDDNVVLVFGHSNAGKTVYFSVLYEILKGREDFKLSPLNNETAANLIENYNLMRGKLLKIKEGRQVEIEGERKFPTMTSETRILKFGLDMTIRKGVKFYTVDYKGETLSIAEPGELRKQFAKFFPFARAALFFLDASVLDTDVLLREQIAAFQTILHDLRDCVPKRVPVGIVITKADFLEGFSASNPVELIPSGAAIYKGRRKERFTRGLAKVNHRRFGEVWARTTERISRTLGNLIDSIGAYTLDFQFFFVSATGGLAKKPTGDVEPPRDLKPCGVSDPLEWAFRRIMFNKRKAFWRYLVKWVFALCLIWVVLFSAINLYHQLSLYGMLDKAEEYRKDKLKPDPSGEPINDSYFNMAKEKYKDYYNKFSVSDFLGAAGLRRVVESRIKSIDDLKSDVVAQQAEEARKNPSKPKQPPKPAYDDKTKAASEEFNKIKEAIAKLPAAERQTALEAKVAEFLQKHASDSLDAGFLKQVEGAPEEYKAAVAAAQAQKFQLELLVENLNPKSKVTIQIGDDPAVDFSNLQGQTPTVSRAITGVGNAGIRFKYVDLSPASTGEPLPDQVDNPIENFYPKLGEGYKLPFGKDYGIVVKLKSGQPPKLP